MQNYIYNFYKENVKFTDKMHNYIVNKISTLPDFYIIKEEDNLSFIFQIELSVEQQDILNDTIIKYTPPQNYKKIVKTQSLNISTDKVSSMDYVSVCTVLYNIITEGELGSISLISNISKSGSYQIRIYDCKNNSILSETDLYYNTNDELIIIDDLQGVPDNDDTFIEIQFKVSEMSSFVNIKTINFNFEVLVQ